MPGKEKGVHIVAGGYEYDRIVKPMIGEYPAKKLIILENKEEKQYPETKKLIKNFLNKINEFPIENEIIPVDIYNYEQVLTKTTNLIKKYSKQNTPIYLNISSAPKLALVAMISAAYLTNKNVEIFYVEPKEYTIPQLLTELNNTNKTNNKELKKINKKFKEKGSAIGIKKYEQIPLFPVEKIKKIDYKILKTIQKENGINSIKELLNKINKNKNKKEKTKRSTIQYRIKKLKNQKLITTKRKNRKLKINITRLGKIYLQKKK